MPKKGKKKVYPTKAAAKKAATKGRYPYKVKGGWSLSKRSTKKKTKSKKRATKKRKTTKKKTTRKKTTRKRATKKATPKRRRRRKTAVSPRSLLGVAEKKWHSNTKAAFNAYWAKNFASASSAQAFAKGISSVTGLSLKTIKASLPMRNFRAAQKNAGMYRNRALQKIDEAFRTKKWSKRYKQAFGGK